MIGATNFAKLLDPALIKPGRFDKQVVVGNPDVKGRTDIIDFYLKKIKAAADVNPSILARGTPGCSGAAWLTLSILLQLKQQLEECQV